MIQRNEFETKPGNLRAPLFGFIAMSVFIFNVLLSADVIAAPEEIQVYLDDFTETGKYGLDLHTNYVASGQQPTVHQFRVTPEFSYGINTNWDTAAYFLTVKNPGIPPETDGIKLRADGDQEHLQEIHLFIGR